MLSAAQIDRFWRDGFLVVPDAVSPSQLTAMNAAIAACVEESRGHCAPYGACVDGRPRFDMGAEHAPDRPALRRVNNPSDAAPACMDVVKNAAVGDLIGPDVKFRHCKINLKLPGTNTEVGYHQDLAYTPNTNDDIVTAPIFYTGADAFPLWKNPMANPNEGVVVRGKPSRKARLRGETVELPDQPKGASFFQVQGQRSAGT